VPGVKRFKKSPVDTGGRPQARDPREHGLRAGVEDEAVGRGDRSQLQRPGPLFLIGGDQERETPGGRPAGRLSVPLGKARPDIHDPLPGGRRSHLRKEGKVGANGAFLLPIEDGVEPDRNPPGIPGKRGQLRELTQSVPIIRDPRLDGRPTQSGDRKVQIKLIISREEVPQTAPIPQEVREILGPKDDRVHRFRGKVDRVDASRRPDDPGLPLAERGGQPLWKRGDEVRAPGGADDAFQGSIPAAGRVCRRGSRRGRI